MTILQNLSEKKLLELKRVQEVFPGAMIGGSSVYDPREGEQDSDFFIPISPDFDREEFQRQLADVGFKMLYTQKWEKYFEALGGGYYDTVSETVSAFFDGMKKNLGLEVLRTDGYDFIPVPIGADADVAAWMAATQPISQMALMTDGETIYNAEGVNMEEVTVDLSKVHSFEQWEKDKTRWTKYASVKNKQISYVGALKGALVEDLIEQEKASAAKAAQQLEAAEKKREQLQSSLYTANHEICRYKEEEKKEIRKMISVLVFGAILALAIYL